MLYALDRRSGKVRWTFAANGPIRSTAAADGENVYFADRTGGLYALDADDGSLQWKLAGGSDGKPLDPWDYYDSSPVLAGRMLFYGSGDHKLYAVDTKTGQVQWSYDRDIRCAQRQPIGLERSTSAIGSAICMRSTRRPGSANGRSGTRAT